MSKNKEFAVAAAVATEPVQVGRTQEEKKKEKRKK